MQNVGSVSPLLRNTLRRTVQLGASTAAPIMLTVLETVFKDKVATPEWQAKLHQIVPSYGTS